MLPGSVMERGEGAWAALGRRACIKNAAAKRRLRRRAVEGRLGEIQNVRSERKAGGIRFAIVANKFNNAD